MVQLRPVLAEVMALAILEVATEAILEVVMEAVTEVVMEVTNLCCYDLHSKIPAAEDYLGYYTLLRDNIHSFL